MKNEADKLQCKNGEAAKITKLHLKEEHTWEEERLTTVT